MLALLAPEGRLMQPAVLELDVRELGLADEASGTASSDK
jgi:hypothetical protein